MAKSYYRTIDGKKYDREMIRIAEESVAGRGDGRISIDDAKKLYKAIIDGNTITKTEQQTLDYIKDNFNFTTPASKWLTGELDDWTSQKRSTQKTKLTQPLKPESAAPESLKPVPTKKVPAKVTGVNRKTSMMWPALSLILLLLLPVAFLIGETRATVEEDPAIKIKILDLESNLQSRQQDIITSESEIKKLNSLILEIKSKQTAPIVKSVKKIEPDVEDVPKINELVVQKLKKILSKEAKSNIKFQFHKENLLVSFIPKQPFFEKGSAMLSPSLKEQLAQFFPEFISTLKVYDQNIEAIQIQGHSSLGWKFSKGFADAYLSNMNLSIRRSRAALRYCFTLDSVEPHLEWLTKRLVSSGLSTSKPFMEAGDEINAANSRRIEIAIVFSSETNRS